MITLRDMRADDLLEKRKTEGGAYVMDITDKSHKPDIRQIAEYIENPLFDELCGHMSAAYGARCDVVYSGDQVLLGWNVRFHKGGRTLCRLYPRTGRFAVLVVVGRKEKERVEALLPALSQTMRDIYLHTPEGMGQRWLLIELSAPDAVYTDVLKLVAIRRESR